MNTGLDQYMDIFKDAVEDSAEKLTKSFEKILIEVIKMCIRDSRWGERCKAGFGDEAHQGVLSSCDWFWDRAGRWNTCS